MKKRRNKTKPTIHKNTNLQKSYVVGADPCFTMATVLRYGEDASVWEHREATRCHKDLVAQNLVAQE